MAKLIDSVKALGEKITGEKINGDTLFDAVKDAGEKMTGKEIEGKELNDIIAETAREYQGGGGTVVVEELPEVGEENTIYELHEDEPADFPWLFTGLDNSREYPHMDFPIIVVENEEQVTREYLQMPWDLEGVDVYVYVKSTNNVYVCWIEPGEQDNTFEKEILHPEEHSLYADSIDFALLSDFDYHVTTSEPGQEYFAILDGTGHFLDGAEFNYENNSNVVPLVLTNAIDKKYGLDLTVGYEEVTEPVPGSTLVNKIDLSLDPNAVLNIFAPQSAHTEISYWVYANNVWTNTEDIGKPVEQEVVYGELLKGVTFDTDAKLVSPYTNEQICNYVAEGKPVILRYHNEFMNENQFMYVYIYDFQDTEMADEYVNQPLYYDNFTCRNYITTDRIQYVYGSDYFYYEVGE